MYKFLLYLGAGMLTFSGAGIIVLCFLDSFTKGLAATMVAGGIILFVGFMMYLAKHDEVFL